MTASVRARSHLPYLTVAASLARAGAAPHFAVSHVSVAAVADAAGVSRSAIYRLWPSQQEFWSDLINFLAVCDDDLSQVPTTATERDAPPAEPIADAVQHALLADRMTLLRVAVAGHPTAGADDSPLGAARAARLAALGEIATATVVALGRRFADGVAAADLAAAITAIGTGLPIAARMGAPEDLRFDSPRFEVTGDAPRGMLGVTIDAVRDALTVPGPAGGAPHARPPGAAPPAADAPEVPGGRRREYLELAARLALAPSVDNSARVLGHVTLDNVAREAGVSRRTIGKSWPDQRTFRLDLFAHLLAHERTAAVDAVRQAAHDSTGGSHVDAFGMVGAQLQRYLVASRHEATFRAFATQLDEPTYAARAIAAHEQHTRACAVQLHRLLSAVNRRARPGVDLRQVATLLFAIQDGFGTLLRTHPSAVRERIDAGASTAGLVERVTAAVLERLTEPLDARADVRRLVALIS